MGSLIGFVPRLRINLQEQAVALPLVLTEWAMSNIPASVARSAQSALRIDIHHHYFPSDLKKEQANVEVGWKTPPENLPWCPKISLQAMNAMKVDFAVLSYPALSSGCISEKNRSTARRRNVLAAGFCREQPDRFGFFATLPFLDDVEGQILCSSGSISLIQRIFRLSSRNQIRIGYLASSWCVTFILLWRGLDGQ